MRKLLMVWLAMLMIVSAALAETVIDPKEARGIVPVDEGLNEIPAGVSPTTGRQLASLAKPSGFAGLAVTGRYLPMLVQIGNDSGGVGERPAL